jgi:hypothetical protein
VAEYVVPRTYESPYDQLLTEVSVMVDSVRDRSYLAVYFMRDIKHQDVADCSSHSANATDRV